MRGEQRIVVAIALEEEEKENSANIPPKKKQKNTPTAVIPTILSPGQTTREKEKKNTHHLDRPA